MATHRRGQDPAGAREERTSRLAVSRSLLKEPVLDRLRHSLLEPGPSFD
jgi:hypothetical protein